MVRAAADPAARGAAPRGGAINRSVVPVTTNTMDAVYGWYTRDRRLQGVIIGVLGVIAMLLAALGVYGRWRCWSPSAAARLRSGWRWGPPVRPSCAWCSGAASASRLSVFVRECCWRAPSPRFCRPIFLGLRAFNLAVVGGAAALLAAMALVASWWPARRGMPGGSDGDTESVGRSVLNDDAPLQRGVGFIIVI